MNTPSIINELTLRELAEAKSLSGAVAVGHRGGFSVTVRYGMTETQRLLATARGETRMFSNLNTLAKFLRKLGITRFEVDTSNHESVRLRAARPDRAEAMRQTRTKLRQAHLNFLQAPDESI
jgi:hypothetical protein